MKNRHSASPESRKAYSDTHSWSNLSNSSRNSCTASTQLKWSVSSSGNYYVEDVADNSIGIFVSTVAFCPSVLFIFLKYSTICFLAVIWITEETMKLVTKLLKKLQKNFLYRTLLAIPDSAQPRDLFDFNHSRESHLKEIAIKQRILLAY